MERRSFLQAAVAGAWALIGGPKLVAGKQKDPDNTLWEATLEMRGRKGEPLARMLVFLRGPRLEELESGKTYELEPLGGLLAAPGGTRQVRINSRLREPVVMPHRPKRKLVSTFEEAIREQPEGGGPAFKKLMEEVDGFLEEQIRLAEEGRIG